MSETIQLPVLALKEALPGLSKVISKRSTLPVLGCVRINSRSPGQLSFEGTDLDATAIYTTDSTPTAKDITVIVPLEDLASVVKGCAKSVSIQLIIENKEARVRYPVGSTWLEKPIATFKEDEWPVIPKIDGEPVPLGPEFRGDLVTALDCASDYKPDLTGGWLDVSDPKAHYIVASDGRHMFSANSFKFDLTESVLLPQHKFLRWSGFHEDGEWSIRVGPRNKEGTAYTQLQSAYWTFILKRPDARLPHWKQVVPNEIKTHVTFSNEAVTFLLDVLPKLPGASQVNAGVTFDFGPMGTIVIGSEGAHSSRVQVDGVQIKGNANTFAADRNLIIKALKLGLTNLGVVDGLSPIVFSDARRKLVIAPLRADSMAKTSATAPVQPPAESPSPEPSTENPQQGDTVKTINRITQTTTTNESNGSGETQQAQDTGSSLKQAVQKVDQIKDALKGVLSDLNDVVKALNQAARDQRATEKEVEEVREALQSLQRIRI